MKNLFFFTSKWFKFIWGFKRLLKDGTNCRPSLKGFSRFQDLFTQCLISTELCYIIRTNIHHHDQFYKQTYNDNNVASTWYSEWRTFWNKTNRFYLPKPNKCTTVWTNTTPWQTLHHIVNKLTKHFNNCVNQGLHNDSTVLFVLLIMLLFVLNIKSTKTFI